MDTYVVSWNGMEIGSNSITKINLDFGGTWPYGFRMDKSGLKKVVEVRQPLDTGKRPFATPHSAIRVCQLDDLPCVSSARQPYNRGMPGTDPNICLCHSYFCPNTS